VVGLLGTGDRSLLDSSDSSGSHSSHIGAASFGLDRLLDLEDVDNLSGDISGLSSVLASFGKGVDLLEECRKHSGDFANSPFFRTGG